MNSDWAERSAVTTAQGYNYSMRLGAVTKRSSGMQQQQHQQQQRALFA